VQLRPDEGPDPRLLVVAVTEEDIRALGNWPASDQTLDQLFQRLEQYQPRVIGLDIYRDLPVEPGHAELATRLQLKTISLLYVKPVILKVLAFRRRLQCQKVLLVLAMCGRSQWRCPSQSVVSDLNLTLHACNSSFGIQVALHYLEKRE